MKKLALSALALFVMTASAMTVHNARRTSSRADVVTNAPYRDGLYLGKLAAEQGSDAHIATTRWARSKDRDTFAQGYWQSYNAALASRSAELSEVDEK